jgi:hypothetical protein
MLGEKLEPVLPRLAALQRDGLLSVEKVAIVERAMHKLSRPTWTQQMWSKPKSCSPTMQPS